MRQLTDTLGGSLRFLDLAPPDTVGLTVDFSNLRFAGEDLAKAVPRLSPRMWNAHVKNGFIEEGGGWDFRPLDTGLTDYRAVLVLLRDLGYDGYLAVECLGPDAANQPRETVRRDRELLQALLEEG
jgi:sugar phosphate isomerase/epimerase